VSILWITITYAAERYFLWPSVKIESADPAATFANTDVTLEGSGFTERPSLMRVWFSGRGAKTEDVRTSVRDVEETSVQFRVPRDLPPGDYKVEITGPLSLPVILRNAASTTLTVIGAPEVHSVEPKSGIRPYGRPGTVAIVRAPPHTKAGIISYFSERHRRLQRQQLPRRFHSGGRP
jgi:hypothetical protein